jgi:hypothetical protein
MHTKNWVIGTSFLMVSLLINTSLSFAEGSTSQGRQTYRISASSVVEDVNLEVDCSIGISVVGNNGRARSASVSNIETMLATVLTDPTINDVVRNYLDEELVGYVRRQFGGADLSSFMQLMEETLDASQDGDWGHYNVERLLILYLSPNDNPKSGFYGTQGRTSQSEFDQLVQLERELLDRACVSIVVFEPDSWYRQQIDPLYGMDLGIVFRYDEEADPDDFPGAIMTNGFDALAPEAQDQFKRSVAWAYNLALRNSH